MATGNISFNSLYEIQHFLFHVPETSKTFQFSLWDSRNATKAITTYSHIFQFSLWDSCFSTRSNSRIVSSFNCLYEILGLGEKNGWYIYNLSILFMRFSRIWYRERSKQVYTFNSLYEILRRGGRRRGIRGILSILFMRFRPCF